MALKVCYKAVDKLEEGRSSFEVIDPEANPSPQGEQHPLEHAKDGFLAKGQTASLRGGTMPTLFDVAHASQPLVNPVGESTSPK